MSLGKKGDARLAPRRWASSVGNTPCGYSKRLRSTPRSSRFALGVTISEFIHGDPTGRVMFVL